jgi:hypothetical protein
MAAQAVKAQAARHRANNASDGSTKDYDSDGRLLDGYLLELVRGRESPSVQDHAKLVSTAHEAHGRHLARMKSLQGRFHNC